MRIRERLSSLGCLLGVSLFVGIILCSIAAGAVFPGINQFAAGRLVCSNGAFVIQQNTYSYRPGESDTQTTDLCVDLESGTKQDVSFPTLLVSGLIYSGAIFILVLVATFIRGLVGRARAASAA